jgi:hypothetical protein
VQTRLKLGVTKAQKKVYNSFFAYRFDFDHGSTFEASRSQQRKLKELRIESVTKETKETKETKVIKETKETGETKEVDPKSKGKMEELLHWFCDPKPVLFLHKTLNDEDLRIALNAPELTKSSTLNQYIPTLIIAAIVSIAKNDRGNKYLALTP